MNATKHIFRGLEGLAAGATAAATIAATRSHAGAEFLAYVGVAAVTLTAWFLAGLARDGSPPAEAKDSSRPAPEPRPLTLLLPEETRQRRDDLLQKLDQLEQLAVDARRLGLDLSADTLDVHHAREEAVGQRDGWQSRAISAEQTIASVHATAAQYTAAPKPRRAPPSFERIPPNEMGGAPLPPVPLLRPVERSPVNLDELSAALSARAAG